MIRQLPLIPTILVVAAAATMIYLGIWQLGRADEKAELIARYTASSTNEELAAFPIAGDGADVWFRMSEITCTDAAPIEPTSGTAKNGAKGWAMRTTCTLANGASATVDLGFSQALQVPEWEGGTVTGYIAPGPRLVANPPQADLYPLAKPDPNDLPNNHLAYTGQWFFFAITALVIYYFAVRSRLAKRD